MNAEITMKTRVNGLFFALCLALAVSPVLGGIVRIFSFLRSCGLPFSDYALDVLIPQFFYPLLLLAVSVGALIFLRIPRREVLRMAPLRAEGVLWFGFFAGCVTVGNILMNVLLDLFARHGLDLPDPIGSDAPETPGQAVGFFLVYAILPALCEEGIFRAGLVGGLKDFHPGAAILLSGIGFALFHASLRQIPYAFGMGCLFAFLYVKTDNLLYPVLFHFANNTWACLLTFLGVFAEPKLQLAVGALGSGCSLVAGVLCGGYLLFKKKFSIRTHPRALSGTQAFHAIVTSFAFWGFVFVFSLLTALNTVWA